MSRIPPIDLDKADVQTAATLKAVKAKLGGLPNIFTTFAQSPAALNGYLQLNEALSGGRLNSRQRELIAIATAQENACEYCLSAHAAIGKGVGLKPEDIERARQGGAIDPVANAITAFALEIVRTRGAVTDAEITRLRDAGIDDGLIVEIAANVVLNVLTNYVNRLAGTDVDFPLVSLQSAA